jgi:hypothetical protein
MRRESTCDQWRDEQLIPLREEETHFFARKELKVLMGSVELLFLGLGYTLSLDGMRSNIQDTGPSFIH